MATTGWQLAGTAEGMGSSGGGSREAVATTGGHSYERGRSRESALGMEQREMVTDSGGPRIYQ